MVAEAPKTPQPEAEVQKKDPVIERAEQDLKDINKGERETKSEIKAHIRTLTGTKERLEAAYDEAANLDKDDQKAVQLLDEIEKVDVELKALEARLLTASEDAEADRKELADRVREKAEKGADRAESKAELKAVVDAQTAIIESKDPAITNDQKKEAHKERDAAEKKLDRIDKQEKRDHAMEEARLYKAEADKIHVEEVAKVEQDTDAKLQALDETGDKKTEEPKPEAPADGKAEDGATSTEKKDKPNSLGERADDFVEGLAKDIAAHPPTTGAEKFSVGWKVFQIRIALLVGAGGDHAWAGKLSEFETTNLRKVIGMTFEANGETKTTPKETKYKIVWVAPDKEYQAADQTTHDIFAQYVGEENWSTVHDRLLAISDGKATIADIRGYLGAHPAPENEGITDLLNDLVEKGAQEETVFFDALEKKGYLLVKKEEKTESSTADVATEENPNKDVEQALAIIQEQELTMDSPSIDFLAAELSKETGLIINPAGLQDLAGRQGVVTELMSKAPEKAAAIIRIVTLSTDEIEATLAKNPVTWSTEEKESVQVAVLSSLTNIVDDYQKRGNTMGEYVEDLEKEESSKALGLKIREALTANEKPETAPAIPPEVAAWGVTMDAGHVYVNGDSIYSIPDGATVEMKWDEATKELTVVLKNPGAEEGQKEKSVSSIKSAEDLKTKLNETAPSPTDK